MKEFNIKINGTSYQVAIEEVGGSPSKSMSTSAPSTTKQNAPEINYTTPVKKAAPVVAAGAASVNAPMPGKIVKVVASAGQTVKKGEVILILEAMKMQNEISAPVDGTLKTISVSAGQNVKPGEVLAVIE